MRTADDAKFITMSILGISVEIQYKFENNGLTWFVVSSYNPDINQQKLLEVLLRNHRTDEIENYLTKIYEEEQYLIDIAPDQFEEDPNTNPFF